MNRSELMELWLQALESGKFKQGAGQLVEDGNKYCCLGVLCEVAKQNGIIKKYEKDAGYLPKGLARFVGLSEEGRFSDPIWRKPRNEPSRRFDDLAQLNDYGFRFKTIAKIIRQQAAEKNFVKKVS